jgi:putative hydrolase of the HAD superfamily
MAGQVPGICNIEAILFDMNGTLRLRVANEPVQRAAARRMLKLLGMDAAPDAFWEKLKQRHKDYSHWAQQRLVQLTEAEIWTDWILPEFPPTQVEPLASELTLAWLEFKGQAVPREGAGIVLKELKQRGYRLGVISNSISRMDIPSSIKKYGWETYFDTVIISSVVKSRKPASEPFWEATRSLQLDPVQCAYLGNRLSKDITGCKQAGFGMAIFLEPPPGSPPQERDNRFEPEAIIRSLPELLDIFPDRHLLCRTG